MARSNPGKVWGLHAIGPQMDRGRARMARDWAGLCPYSKVSKVTVGLESYGAEPRVVRTKHRKFDDQNAFERDDQDNLAVHRAHVVVVLRELHQHQHHPQKIHRRTCGRNCREQST